MADFTINPFTKFSKDWGLVTAGSGDSANTMTVGWGGLGVLWGKDVVYIFIRYSRYTKELIDSGDTFSLAFLKDGYNDALKYCGSKSGRDGNKWEACGLTPIEKDGITYPAESETAFLCKKMAEIPIEPKTFIDPEIEPKWYADGDFHVMYVGEILDIVKAY